MDYQVPIKAKRFDASQKEYRVVEGNRGSARGEILEKFLDRLNPAREAGGYEPYTVQRIAVLLAHVPTDDLYVFYKQCDQAGIPFGAYFHWSLKPGTGQYDKKGSNGATNILS
jgi:hypothetical protein